MTVAPPDHSQRVMRSYMAGVYLAVNAIRDAYVLVDGPECAYMKTQFVQGNHDWLSTLTSVSGYHRVANTALHPAQMARSRENDLSGFLSRLASHPTSGAVLLTSMPMAFVTGSDYERLCREVAETTGKPVIHLPSKSLSGDWLDGYAESLLALARWLPLDCAPERASDPRKVAIVGYLYDRNEGDHRANVRDLRGMLSALGLETVSIWLEGQTCAELGAVARAGTILSFPYGRRAADALARRTGARLIECELPFGLDATERLITTLGEALGVQEAARRLVERELGEVIPRLEWVIPFVFQGRSLGFIGDPHMACGVQECAASVGARLAFAVITDPPAHSRDLAERLGPEVRLLVWPKQAAFRRFLEEVLEQEAVELLVTNQHGVGTPGVAWAEIGFPSFYTHALYDRPFLGFRGALAFYDTLANAARRFEVVQACASRLPGKGGGHTR